MMCLYEFNFTVYKNNLMYSRCISFFLLYVNWVVDVSYVISADCVPVVIIKLLMKSDAIGRSLCD